MADPRHAPHACTRAAHGWGGVGWGGVEMRIPDALRVSTDTVWVLRTVSAPRMTPCFAAVVVLSDGCSIERSSESRFTRAPAM